MTCGESKVGLVRLTDSGPEGADDAAPTLTTTTLPKKGPVMATQETTVQRPFFQPRPGIDGLTARYLLFRLAEKTIIASNGCWEWTGGKTERGYAILDIKNPHWPESAVLLHRVAYEVCVEAIPDGLCVLHRCDNPSCIRPDHLFLGTNSDNSNDKVSKGRQASGQVVRKDHEHLVGEGVKNSKLTAELVREIRARAASGESQASIARLLKISDTHISDVVRRRSWRHIA